MARARNVKVVGANGETVVRTVEGRMTLDQLLEGDRFGAVRDAIRRDGYYDTGKKRLFVQTRPIEGSSDREVLAIAAIARDPGRSDEYLQSIADFQVQTGNRRSAVEQYWQIYKNEGLINNAVNKVAALLSGGGRFKVAGTRKGKRRKPTEELLTVLRWWQGHVNQVALEAVVTGSRGLRQVNRAGARQALVEGSWVARTVWQDIEVPGLGKYALPMVVQSITTGQLEPVKAVVGTSIELFEWTPPQAVVQELRKSTDKDAAKLYKKYFDNDIANQLRKNGKARLDPALLIHVKHRGTDLEPFGESIIQSAFSGIRYRRAIEAADLVSMENLINRITIVMVGSADPKSPYSKADVAAARAQLMQQFFDDPSVNMTIVWQGDDVNIKDVGAQNQVLSLDERHRIGDSKVKSAMGVPDAILSGTLSGEGKASGVASMLSASAQLEELQDNCANVWWTLGERVALENGFEDTEMVFEFDESIFVDKTEQLSQARNHYTAGLYSIRTTVLESGKDPEAEYEQMCFEKGLTPGEATWAEAFAAPQGLQGQGDGKVPGNGRTPDDDTGKSTPERAPERKSPRESK